MRIPKKYGESRLDNCPFCGKQAICKNPQGLLVCLEHKDSKLPDIKCACGSWLDIRTGKFGPYFFCMNCGNINLRKGLELMEHSKVQQQKHEPEQEKEIKKQPEKDLRKQFGTQEKTKVNFQKNKDRFILDSGKYDDFDYGIE